jgi:hypothetical protein
MDPNGKPHPENPCEFEREVVSSSRPPAWIVYKETEQLAQALKATYRATEKPLDTVRKHLMKIFQEKLTQEDKRLLVKNYVEAYNKAKAKMNEIKGIVRDAIGEGMSEEELNKQTNPHLAWHGAGRAAARNARHPAVAVASASRKQGNYQVIVTETIEGDLGEEEKITLYYENAGNRIEATRIYNRLKADPKYKDFNIAVEPNRQEAETSFMGASAINMQRLVDNAIDKLKAQGEVDPGVASQIRLNILESLSDELKARRCRFAIKRAVTSSRVPETNLKEVLYDCVMDGRA